MLALFGSGVLRRSDVAGGGALFGDPAAIGGVEGVAGGDGFEPGYIANDEVGREGENHRRFPFAGVAHVLLNEVFAALVGFGEIPIRGEEEKQIVPIPILLAKLEDGLFGGDDVAAVTVQEEDAFESVAEEVFGEVFKEVQVKARRGGDRAGVIDVVIGVAEPLERGEKGAIAGGGFGTADDFAEKEAIGIDREVVAVLFDSGDGDNDWDVFVEGLYGRPGQIC